MECLICRDLERSYGVGLREYAEACSSSYYAVSKEFAAVKNVDMERALYALEEHRLLCAFAVKVVALSPERSESAHLIELAA
jgi:hypothetical protein